MSDGNGWVCCKQGHQHWGRFGAAGLLVTTGDRVLLQHRAAWTHEGGTWAILGGARDRHETPVAAALREAAEEAALDAAAVTPFGEWIEDHGGWSYTTIVARIATAVDFAPANAESTAIRWWSIAAVTGLPLHCGFASSWPALRELIAAATYLP